MNPFQADDFYHSQSDDETSDGFAFLRRNRRDIGMGSLNVSDVRSQIYLWHSLVCSLEMPRAQRAWYATAWFSCGKQWRCDLPLTYSSATWTAARTLGWCPMLEQAKRTCERVSTVTARKGSGPQKPPYSKSFREIGLQFLV